MNWRRDIIPPIALIAILLLGCVNQLSNKGVLIDLVPVLSKDLFKLVNHQ